MMQRTEEQVERGWVDHCKLFRGRQNERSSILGIFFAFSGREHGETEVVDVGEETGNVLDFFECDEVFSTAHFACVNL